MRSTGQRMYLQNIKNLSLQSVAKVRASKNWPTYNWEKVIDSLRKDYHIIQLGDKTETNYKFTKRYAGTLTMRESAALLSQCRLFVGPDSLLMHVINGLNVPSVIIFGGSRPIECFGYSENVNIILNLIVVHVGFTKDMNVITI